jgi:hypothetical protein
MESAPHPNDSTQAARAETEAERQRRFAWEAKMIAEADVEIEAGRFVDVDAWIYSLGTDRELPVPQPRR